MSTLKFALSLSLFLSFAVFLSIYPRSQAFAEEGAKSEKKEGEKKEGEKKEEKKELPEWVELQAQIGTLDTRRQQKEENITKLIEEKRHLPANSPQVKTVIDEMVSDYNEMRKLTEERDKKLTILKFRFPEKGAAEDRKYDHTEVKPLEQLEKELGLDGRLNRNMKKVRSQYQTQTNETAAISDEGGEAKKTSSGDAKGTKKPTEKSIDETGQLTLKK